MKGLVEEAVKYDRDGIEIEFLNSRKKSEHTKVRPCYRELLRLWPDFGGRRRRMLPTCSKRSNRIGELHSVPVWVTFARDTSRTIRADRGGDGKTKSVALSSPSQMAHRVSRSVSEKGLGECRSVAHLFELQIARKRSRKRSRRRLKTWINCLPPLLRFYWNLPLLAPAGN